MSSLVSIIMPAFNACETISTSIESVLSQTYQNFELIICDDGSSDQTLKIIASFDSEKIIVCENSFSKGAAGARNSALSLATGRYIAFLDSDDVWHKKKLEVQVKHMRDSNSFFSYGDYSTFNKTTENLISHRKCPSKISYNNMLRSCDVGCLTVMLDREFLGNIIFPETPKEDYALWLTLLQSGGKATKYDGILAYYRVGRNSISSNKFKELFRQSYVLKNIAGIHGFNLYWCLFVYAIKGALKTYR